MEYKLVMTSLDETIKTLLVPLGKKECVEKGATIILEGSHDDDAFYIVRGKVKVVHINRDGYMTHLATFVTGEIFGYFASLTKGMRTATVLAEEDTELLRISGSITRSAIETHAGLKDQLMISMANEFINTKERLIENNFVPADERIISLLKENREPDGRILTPRGWKTKQAEVLGIARENFSRHLSDLQRQGIVQIHKDHIVLLK